MKRICYLFCYGSVAIGYRKCVCFFKKNYVWEKKNYSCRWARSRYVYIYIYIARNNSAKCWKRLKIHNMLNFSLKLNQDLK